MTTRTRIFFPFIALALAALPIGCASKDSGPVDTAEAPAPVVAAGDQADPGDSSDPASADDASEPGDPGDVAEAPAADAWLRTLTSGLDLRPDQKQAVDQAIADLAAKGLSLSDAKKALASALADQVAAGSVDEGRLPLDPVEQAAMSLRTSLGDALAKIHASLDAGQRHKLATELRARGKQHGRGNGHRGKGPRAKRHPGKRLAKLAAQLNLTPEQRVKLQALMKARAENRRNHRGRGRARAMGDGPEGPQGPEDPQDRGSAVADAFDGDRFDRRALEQGDDEARDEASGLAAFTRDALPVLTAGQRAKLAEILRSHG